MPSDNLPDFQPGPIRAADLQAVVEFLRRYAIKPAGNTDIRVTATAGGTFVAARTTPGFWAKLTAEPSTGQYTFNRVLAATAGAGLWTDDSSLTGTAHAINGTSGLALPVVVWMEVVATADGSQYRFLFDRCS